MAESATPEQKVIVVDFGAQYGQLIARRVRDLHVYSEIVPCDITAEEVRAIAPAAIILSGGPASVYAEDAPSIDPEILALGIPVLGFCYGQQAMAVALGGEVGHTEKGEYGPAVITRAGESALFDGTPGEQTVWMSHRDAVSRVPEGFSITSRTEVCPVASMEYPERRLFATQFHPEVRHTEFGQTMLRNFLFGVCELEPDWTMDSIIDDSIEAIRAEVGDDRVILGLSGGVDSSVVAALCARAIGKQLTCVFVNHGFLRKGEPEEVEEVFTKQFDVDFIHVHAEERYLELLRGVTDPEQKRRIIGTQFWKEFFAVAEDLAQDGRPVKYLAQVCQTPQAGKGAFVPGRFAMTCCVQDIQFVGMPCKYDDYKSLEQRSWITITAKINVKYHPIYKGQTPDSTGPVLTALSVEPAEKPTQDVVMFS